MAQSCMQIIRQNWNEDAMINAINAVEEGMPYKTAAKNFSVPIMSLKRRVKGKNVQALGGIKVMGRNKVFTDEQEQELIQYIKDKEETVGGLTIVDFRKFAFDMAEYYKIKHPFSRKSRKAGKDWFNAFRLRHHDIRQAFNKPVINNFRHTYVENDPLEDL